jgi:hypothetical protein
MAKDILSDLNMGSVARLTNLPDPTLAQHAATKAYVDNAVEGLSWKASVRVASAGSNINLAAPGATIDGITMSSNDRFLAKDQSTPSQNGIYIWNGAATPATRAADASTFNELEQAIVTVQEGTNAATTWRQTNVNGTIDSSAVAFVAFGTSAGAATESSAGIAELATQGETDTGSDDARIVTPLKLTNWSGRKRKASAVIGDNSATSFNIDHNFNTRQVIVEVYKNSGNYDTVLCDVTRPTVNRVTLTFAVAPTSSAYEVVIIG